MRYLDTWQSPLQAATIFWGVHIPMLSVNFAKNDAGTLQCSRWVMLDLVLSRGRLGDVESVVELVVVMHVFVGRGVRLEHKELGVIEIRSDAGAV
jgi:hypothetical protein